MLDNQTEIVKVDYKVATDKQISFMKGLFWKYVQIKLGNRFEPNSWEWKSEGNWNKFLSYHPELLIGDDRTGLNYKNLDTIYSLSASKIINHLKTTVDANPNQIYQRSQFVSSFSRAFFDHLKIA